MAFLPKTLTLESTKLDSFYWIRPKKLWQHIAIMKMKETELDELRLLSNQDPEKALAKIQSWLDRACVEADFSLLAQAHEIRIQQMGKWNPALEITRHDTPIRVDLLNAYKNGHRAFVLSALQIYVGPHQMQELYDEANDDEEVRDLLTSLDSDCETYEIETDGDIE